ncbi:hypothetical protein ISR94_02020 [Candidatus Microgenomates bacterium]|nr:hypothetical protein [Candidatus Microgenomates bacterium]
MSVKICEGCTKAERSSEFEGMTATVIGLDDATTGGKAYPIQRNCSAGNTAWSNSPCVINSEYNPISSPTEVTVLNHGGIIINPHTED